MSSKNNSKQTPDYAIRLDFPSPFEEALPTLDETLADVVRGDEKKRQGNPKESRDEKEEDTKKTKT